MILVAAMFVVVASVPLAGGSLGAVGQLRFRRAPLVVGAMALQLLVLQVAPDGLPAVALPVGHVVSYLFAGAFVAANRQLPGLPLVGVGGAANLAAIATNGGVMPASPAAVAAAGLDPTGAFVNSAPDGDALLWFLGDVFAVPHPLPLANVFSVGDVLLLVGLAVLLHRVSGSALRIRWEAAAARTTG